MLKKILSKLYVWHLLLSKHHIRKKSLEVVDRAIGMLNSTNSTGGVPKQGDMAYLRTRECLNRFDKKFIEKHDHQAQSINSYIQGIDNPYNFSFEADCKWNAMLTIVVFCHVYDIHLAQLPSYFSTLSNHLGGNIGYCNPNVSMWDDYYGPDFVGLLVDNQPDHLRKHTDSGTLKEWQVLHFYKDKDSNK